jgi:phosphoglycerate dehydrogenase-like enzyme
MEDVVVVIGAGQIGQAIARRVGVGKPLAAHSPGVNEPDGPLSECGG